MHHIVAKENLDLLGARSNVKVRRPAEKMVEVIDDVERSEQKVRNNLKLVSLARSRGRWSLSSTEHVAKWLWMDRGCRWPKEVVRDDYKLIVIFGKVLVCNYNKLSWKISPGAN